MKKLLLISICLTSFLLIKAQVPNDDCSTAIDLGILSSNINVCSDGTITSSIAAWGNTNGATPSSPYYYMSNCFGYLDSTTILADDIWFKFKTPSTGIILRVPTSDTIHINLYNGTDCNNLQPSGCWTHDMTQMEHDFYSNNDTSIWNYIQISGTAPGNSLLCGICLRMWISGVPFGTIQVNNNVSIQENNLDIKNFQLISNPNTGTFELQLNRPLNKEADIEVIDLKGIIVYKQILELNKTNYQITLPKDISNGIYSCIITSNNEREIKKIVIVK